jgi:hypothetical protein
MGSNNARRQSALERERLRRAAVTQPQLPVHKTRRRAAERCGWCQGAIEVQATGRIPKWCSASCRQRAWEQRRAAASGRCAVEVVERVVHVAVERERKPRHREWPPLLHELAAQLVAGRIYARDLPDLGDALANVFAAYRGRR